MAWIIWGKILIYIVMGYYIINLHTHTFKHHVLYLQEIDWLLISRSLFHVARQVFSAFHPEKGRENKAQSEKQSSCKEFPPYFNIRHILKVNTHLMQDCASKKLTSSRDHLTLHRVFLSLLFSLLSASVECCSSSSSLLKMHKKRGTFYSSWSKHQKIGLATLFYWYWR